ncbi:MAG: ArsA family ATPase [Deltaproteobacteria bacterium]|nr:ArsA family ATPase [Deltaproteobacteria bacterium]
MSGEVSKLIRESRIIVCCGAGGVGKTTTSGAIAIAGARMGRRVLVLTIDPSKRLAEALGVERNPPAPVTLPADRLQAVGIQAPGTLDAWMLDPKLIADQEVRAIVKNPEDIEKLLSNRIYKHVTTMVAGMHEYTAMQALHRFVLSGRYDLVVLDTPPSRHALDFLEAPSRLSRFLDGRVFKMFMPAETTGGLRRAAGSLVSRVLGGVLGEQFAGDLSVFFGVFAGVLGTLNRDVSGMRDFLSKPDVAFLLVTSPAPAALEEALFFQRKTDELKLPFRGFVLNRSHAYDYGRKFPETALLIGHSIARTTAEKLQNLAESEKDLIGRDQELVKDLARRAGVGGFATALPVLLPNETEMRKLETLADQFKGA